MGSEKPSDSMPKRKKKRGGTRFSNSKALRRSALRKTGASRSSGDERGPVEFDGEDEGAGPEFRRNVKMRSINLDTVVEISEIEKCNEEEEWRSFGEEQEHGRRSSTSSDSLSYYIGGHAGGDVGGDGVAVDSERHVC